MVQFKLRTPLPSSGGAGAVLIRLDGGDAKSFDPENCIVAWLGWSVRRMMGKHGENTGKTEWGNIGKQVENIRNHGKNGECNWTNGGKHVGTWVGKDMDKVVMRPANIGERWILNKQTW